LAAIEDVKQQEVISALSCYGGDEGTNSTFTPSAIALAQKAHIRLVNGTDLRTAFESMSKLSES